jgi:hypothetical protein
MKILKKSINQDVLIEALIILIVVHNLSFCLIEWPAFHIFYQIFNAAYESKIIIYYAELRNKVEKSFQKYKNIVRKAFQGAFFYIYIFLNIWILLNR